MNAIAILAISGYFANTVFIIRDIYRQAITSTPLYFAWLGVSSHLVYLFAHYQARQGLDYHFFNITSLVAALVSLLLLIASVSKPVEKLGIAVFPIAGLMLALSALLNQDTAPVLQQHHWAMTLHILASIIAFSLLNIAALQAILLAVQNQQLKSHPPKRFIQSLPPLQTMETLLFQMIAIGVSFLSVALLTGFLFIEDLFAQHLVHKTVLSIIAWWVFVGLLMGRYRYGWRGKIAMKWTLAGFCLLLLAYFGSKFVLELILHR